MAKINYWLMKSEPLVFSIDDLKKAPGQTTFWDGVRNYQARNYLKQMRIGDRVLFYHSNAEPSGVAGTAEVVEEAYPDHTAFDMTHPHFDPKSDPANPTWFMVDVKFVTAFPEPIPLHVLKTTPGLEKMPVVQRGTRLSIHPVTKDEWDIVLKLGKRGK